MTIRLNGLQQGHAGDIKAPRFGTEAPKRPENEPAKDTANFHTATGIPGVAMAYLPGAETYRPTFDKLFTGFTPGDLFRKLNPGQPHDSDLLAWAFTRRKQEAPTPDRARAIAARLASELMAALDDSTPPPATNGDTERRQKVDIEGLMAKTGLLRHQAEHLEESGRFLLGYANHRFDSFRYGVARFFYDMASAVVENRQRYFDELKRQQDEAKATEERAWRDSRNQKPAPPADS